MEALEHDRMLTRSERTKTKATAIDIGETKTDDAFAAPGPDVSGSRLRNRRGGGFEAGGGAGRGRPDGKRGRGGRGGGAFGHGNGLVVPEVDQEGGYSTGGEVSYPPSSSKDRTGQKSLKYTKSDSSKNTNIPPALSTPTASLWHLSRLVPSTTSQMHPTLLPPGQDRPLTLTTIRLALRLSTLLYLRFLTLFLDLSRPRLAAYLVGRLVKGALPAFKIWANARLLDLVQESFSMSAAGTSGVQVMMVVDRGRVLRMAALSLFASTSSTIFQHLTSTNDLIIQQTLDHHIERSYLSSQLSLDIPTLSDPYIDALMYEAGAFAGFESRQRRAVAAGGDGRGGRDARAMTTKPFGAMNRVVGLITGLVEVGAAGGLLVNTLRQATAEHGGGQGNVLGHHLPWPANLIPIPSGSAILILLSFLPSLFSILATFSLFSLPNPRTLSSRSGKLFNWQSARKEERDIKDLGRNGGFKQEVVLFELKDWVMSKWEQVRERQVEDQMRQREMVGMWGVGFSLGQEAIQTSFYTLLALRSFGTSVSLGSIRLYQSTADSLISSIRSVTNNLAECVQIVFYMAAYFEAVEIRKIMETKGRRGLLLMSSSDGSSEVEMNRTRPPLLDYETTRREGGMRIEARSLGFAYPGMQTSVLHDINLVIEPGEVLALVGTNGSGKTSLVKVLMGLYDHTGDLLINGYPAESFPPAQIHQRTTCCFQDHSKYSLTLRENVGIGNVPLMDSTPEIERALQKGGAEALEGTIGLDGMLDRYGVPDRTGGEDGDGGGQEQEEEMMGPPPEMRDQMGGGRGGRGGRGGGAGGLMSGLGGSGGRGGFGGRMGPPPGDFDMGPPPPGFDGMGPPELTMNGSRKKEEKHPLSGGQWQRVALARAFIRSDQADLVVFDEPSAALDARAESELFKRIHALSNGADGRRTTTIYISHRFSTVKKADKIAVVDQGTIAEFGNHEQLMAKRGIYHELFTLQKEGFE